MSRLSCLPRPLAASLWPVLAPCLAWAESPLASESNAVQLPMIAVEASADPGDDGLQAANATGSRLGLSALNTPASVTTLGQRELAHRANATVQEALARSPGITSLAAPGNGNTALAARGFTGHSSVMTLFDGTRLYTGAGTQSFPVDPWRVERIEVLRGPASVLYGEGATGAVVNVVPKAPFEGPVRNHLRLGYGSYDRQQQALDSGGSLNHSLSYRLTLDQQQSHGWVERGDSHSLGLSGAMRWQASEDLSVTLAQDYGHSEPMAWFGTPLIDGHYQDSLRGRNYNVRDARQRYTDQWTRLDTDWDLSDSLSARNQLYYISSRRHWRNAETYDWSASQGQLLRGSYLEIKHNEHQLGDRQTFTFDHWLLGLRSRTVVGAEYNRVRFAVANNSPYLDVGGAYIDPWQPGSGQFQSQSPFLPLASSSAHTVALFAENRLQLSERWSLVTGLRRDRNQLDRNDQRNGSHSGATLPGGNWRAGLVFAATEQLSLYGQYSTSEDGVSNLVSLTPTQQQLDLSRATQAELGLKQQFGHGRGEWTLAAYQIVKKKLLTTDPLTHLTEQVGQQSSQGLEATLELALAANWQLSANASVVDARYDRFSQTEAGEVVSRAGNRPTNVPRRSANFWLSYAPTERLAAGAGLRYVDRRYANAANSASVPGYTVADATLGWRVIPAMRLGLELNNLFDRRYANASENSGQQWLMGQPRSVFATVDYRF